MSINDQQLHRQLMGRSTTLSSSPHIILHDPFLDISSSPYPSPRSVLPLSTSSYLPPRPFDPDLEAERVRRRKLEARRSVSIHQSPRTLPSRCSSRPSSIVSATLPASHRIPSPRLNPSPLSQVHHPSPLRSASTPTFDHPATPHDSSHHHPSDKSRQKQIKAEYEKMRFELLQLERSRLKTLASSKSSSIIPHHPTKTSWITSLYSSKNKQDRVMVVPHHYQPDLSKDAKDKDPFRKSLLTPLQSLISSPKTPPHPPLISDKPKRQRTLTRMFGTLLSSANTKPPSTPSPLPDILQPHHVPKETHLLACSRTTTSTGTTLSSLTKPSESLSNPLLKPSLQLASSSSRKSRPALPPSFAPCPSYQAGSPSLLDVTQVLPLRTPLLPPRVLVSQSSSSSISSSQLDDSNRLVTSQALPIDQDISYNRQDEEDPDQGHNDDDDDQYVDPIDHQDHVEQQEQEVAKLGSVRQGTGVMVVVLDDDHHP